MFIRFVGIRGPNPSEFTQVRTTIVGAPQSCYPACQTVCSMESGAQECQDMVTKWPSNSGNSRKDQEFWEGPGILGETRDTGGRPRVYPDIPWYRVDRGVLECSRVHWLTYYYPVRLECVRCWSEPNNTILCPAFFLT